HIYACVYVDTSRCGVACEGGANAETPCEPRTSDRYVVPLEYTNASNPAYEGPLVFTAEFLLRAIVKVSLAQFGYPDLWRSPYWRAVKAACEELVARERAGNTPSAGASAGAIEPPEGTS